MLDLYRRAEIRRFRIILVALPIVFGVAIAVVPSAGWRTTLAVVFVLAVLTTLTHYSDDAVHHRAWYRAAKRRWVR